MMTLFIGVKKKMQNQFQYMTCQQIYIFRTQAYAHGFEQYKDFFGYCKKLVNGKWGNAERKTDELKFICYRKAYNIDITLNNVCPNVCNIYMSGGVIVSPGYPIGVELSAGGRLYQLVGKNEYYIIIRIENIDIDNNIKIYRTWIQTEANLIATVDNSFVGLDINVPHNHALIYLNSMFYSYHF